ncbi:MAG: LytR/AlgR family response regulator transcription factor [Candidatus Ornithomonoglobus sp.]
MRLAICDDETAELAHISAYADEYIKSRGLDIELLSFTDARSLLEYDNAHGGSSIYLLDVIMPDMNGIELGHEIHKRNKKSVIIYLTTSREFSISAFRVRAFSYLLKPVNKTELFSELDECFESMEKPVSRLIIKTAGGSVCLSLNDIMSIEYSDHRLIYHFHGGRSAEGLYQKLPFEKQAAEFVKSGLFVKVSASHLVNMQNVKLITADEFIMTNGTRYKITRRYSDARKTYIDFMLNNPGRRHA